MQNCLALLTFVCGDRASNYMLNGRGVAGQCRRVVASWEGVCSRSWLWRGAAMCERSCKAFNELCCQLSHASLSVCVCVREGCACVHI